VNEFKFEITAALGILSEGTKGWQKEVNMISWNERGPKLDIRDWGPEHAKMGRGITLNRDEWQKLKDILNHLDLERE